VCKVCVGGCQSAGVHRTLVIEYCIIIYETRHCDHRVHHPRTKRLATSDVLESFHLVGESQLAVVPSVLLCVCVLCVVCRGLVAAPWPSQGLSASC
jgi:hypothetical protein